MFSADELANFRDAQVDHMMDLCFVQVYSETFNSFGEPIATYTDAATATVCGLDMRPGREVQEPDKTVTRYDATLRLPITASVTVRDRIKITARFGEVITPLVFAVVGPVQRGPSGIRVLLEKVNP